MIRAKEIRVVDEEAGQLGIMAPEEALAIAKSRELDLVEVAPGANPPVCRIMNYGKFQYQKSKRAHEAKKNQRQVVIKEVKFRPRRRSMTSSSRKTTSCGFWKRGTRPRRPSSSAAGRWRTRNWGAG